MYQPIFEIPCFLTLNFMVTLFISHFLFSTELRHHYLRLIYMLFDLYNPSNLFSFVRNSITYPCEIYIIRPITLVLLNPSLNYLLLISYHEVDSLEQDN